MLFLRNVLRFMCVSFVMIRLPPIQVASLAQASWSASAAVTLPGPGGNSAALQLQLKSKTLRSAGTPPPGAPPLISQSQNSAGGTV